MRTTADVVIIGGGIQGVSALYYLAESGIRNTVLVEMDKLASGTTAYTAGWIMLQQPRREQMQLSQISFAEFRSFEDKFGVDIGFRQKGSLSINTIGHSDEMRERAQLQKSLGIPVKILTASEIKSMAPILNVSDIELGLYCEEDGVVDANAIVYAYSKAAKLLGAEVEEGVKAIDIIVQNAKVIGVKTTRGLIATPFVVNAAGIYAKEVGKWIGLDIPITNALRHIVVTDLLIPEDMPLIEVLNPVQIYIGSTGGRADYTVGSFETDRFEHKPDLMLLIKTHLDDLMHRAPALAEAGIVTCTAGIRSLTPDGLPILGPVEEVSGYINDCGWGGTGISHGPAGGQVIAECIAGTSNLPVSIEPFLMKRFQTAKT